MKFTFKKITAGWYKVLVDGIVIGSVTTSWDWWAIEIGTGEQAKRVLGAPSTRKAAAEMLVAAWEVAQ